MGDQQVSISFDGPLAIIDLGPGKHVFNNDYLRTLDAALDKVLSEPSAKALVTIGQGKFFSNGIDLQWLTSQEPDVMRKFMQRFCEYFIRLMTFPLPTVAAVNGHAMAGGALLALSHDYRVMNSERGWFCFPEVHIPLTFPLIILEMIRCKLPVGPAQTDILLMGARYTAQDCRRTGIAQEVVPEAQLLEAAKRIATNTLKLGEIRRDVLEITKKDVYKNLLDAVKNVGFKGDISQLSKMAKI